MTTPRFLLDEHVWHGLVRIALENGTDAVPVQTVLPEGIDDEEVLALAADQGRILLTSNAEEFRPLAEEWFFAGREHWGIILVPGQTNKSLLSHGLSHIVHRYTAESFKNSYRFIQEFV
jgi:hypothetical protein